MKLTLPVAILGVALLGAPILAERFAPGASASVGAMCTALALLVRSPLSGAAKSKEEDE